MYHDLNVEHHYFLRLVHNLPPNQGATTLQEGKNKNSWLAFLNSRSGYGRDGLSINGQSEECLAYC
jgi:hypothetical protein